MRELKFLSNSCNWHGTVFFFLIAFKQTLEKSDLQFFDMRFYEVTGLIRSEN